MKIEELLEDLTGDLRRARLKRSQDTKTVQLHRLNRDGRPSGMRDARTYHNTPDEAKAHHDNLVKLNPGHHIAHIMYSGDGDETMQAKFVNGQATTAPGGVYK
jgi:hypothetical protein